MSNDNEKKTPKSILEHKYSWLFDREWQQIHNRMEGNAFTFFIGSNGTGKSYAGLKRMEILGVNENDEHGTLFDIDHLENHVFFDKQEMLNKIAELEKLGLEERRGYQLMLDEAQMSVNAKEWNDRKVLEFSKDMTTIRSSRLSITLNMPTHRMITTDLRQLGTYQCEMFPSEKIDRNRGISFSKLHFLTLKPHEGEIWRNRPIITQPLFNKLTGLKVKRKVRLNEIAWKLPSAKVKHSYENLKRAFREKQAENKVKRQTENLTPKMSLVHNIADQVRLNKDMFRDPIKVFSHVLIMREFKCGESTAYNVQRLLKKEELGI